MFITREEMLDILLPYQQRLIPLIAAGATNEDIARELGVKRITVQSAVVRILSALDLVNRTEIAALYWGQQPYSWRDR